MKKKQSAGRYSKRSSGNPKNTRSALIAVICAAVVVLTCVIIVGCQYLGGVTPGKIMDNVTIGGINIGGMSKQEATDAITDALQKAYAEKPMVVTVLDQQITLDPAATGIRADIDAMVEAAYAMGRTGSLSERKQQQQQAEAGPVAADVAPYLSINTEALNIQLGSLVSHFDTVLEQTTYEIVTTPAAEEGGDPTHALKIKMGTPGYDINLEKLTEQVMDAYAQLNFQLNVECKMTEPDALDMEKLAKEINQEAVPAVMDPATFVITPHVAGRAFDQAALEKLLVADNYGKELNFDLQTILPEVTTQSLEATLFCDVLSTYTSKNGSFTGRNENLRLACASINNIVLLPGESFDYNMALGERTKEKGYKEAAAYFNGETIAELGGGICQVSSTLYYCALMADMEITARTEHGYVSSYMPLGMDATVSWKGPEFRFKNSSEYPIRIEAVSDRGNVTVKIVGTDYKDYYIKMRYEVLDTVDYEETEQIVRKSENTKYWNDGDILVTPYTGYTVRTYRCKIDKTTNREISRTLEDYSYYNKRDLVRVKIVPDDWVDPSDPTVSGPSGETTLPPVQPTDPPGGTTTPPQETTTPPQETTTPPQETTTPPQETTTPPQETTTPPVQETTTPPQETTAAAA